MTCSLIFRLSFLVGAILLSKIPYSSCFTISSSSQQSGIGATTRDGIFSRHNLQNHHSTYQSLQRLSLSSTASQDQQSSSDDVSFADEDEDEDDDDDSMVAVEEYEEGEGGDNNSSDEDLVLDFISMVEATPVGELDIDEITLLREVMKTIPKEIGGTDGAQMVQSLLYRLFGEWQASGVENESSFDDDIDGNNDYWEPNYIDFKTCLQAWELSDDKETVTHVMDLLAEQRDFYNNGLVSVKPDLEIFQIVFRVLKSSRERGIDRRAYSIYQSLSDYDVIPDEEIYSSIISLTAKSRDRGAASRAENLLKEAVERYPPRQLPDGTVKGITTDTFNVVVTSWAKSSDEKGPDRAEQLIVYMDEIDTQNGDLKVCNPNTKTFTSLIDAYAQTNEWDGVRQAEMILNRLLDQYMNDESDTDHLEPNIATWTIVISAWARLSKKNSKDAADNADKLLKRMETLYEAGRITFPPDVITYVTCMNALAYSKKPNGPYRAEELLDEMNEKYLDGDDTMKPSSRSIKVVIDSYVKKGKMENAESVLDKYEETLEANDTPEGVKELRDTYRSVLLGYTKTESPVQAQTYLEYMIEEGLKPDAMCFNR